MRNLTKRIAQTVAVVALLAPASRATAGDLVPLKGTITIVPDGTPTVVVSNEPPIVRQQRHITGVVSHLGRVEGTIVQNVNRRDLTFAGSFVLIGANGDAVSGDVTGSLLFGDDPTALDVVEEIVITGGTGRFAGATGEADGEGLAFIATGRAEETEEIVITGGTGRFAGATGEADGEGLAFIATGRAEETFEGFISSPGSLRR
jgi:hypothetical protein